MQAWETSIDRQLAARLARPIVRPGVIRMALVRRILAGVAAMTGRVPLLARFRRHRELAATTPIVYAHWTRSAPVETTTPRPAAPPIVHAVPSCAVERSSAPASTPAGPRDLPASTTAHPIPLRELPAPATARPIAPNPATAPASASPAMRDARPDASHVSSRELERSADPVIRRSRVGAPLPARPQTTRPSEDHGQQPARPLIALGQPAGELRTRGATAGPIVRARPRANAAGVPAMIAAPVIPARTPIVAPRTTRPAPLPVPALRPAIASAKRPGRVLVEHRPVPVVAARSGDGERARARELPLAQPAPAMAPAAAPAALAALPGAATPRPLAAPRPLADTAPPPAPPPPKIDLPRLAEQVQRILVRQAAHTRARQGLPR